jgi:SH3 domain
LGHTVVTQPKGVSSGNATEEKEDDESESNNDDTLADQFESLSTSVSEPTFPMNATALWPWSADNQLSFHSGDAITIESYLDENWAGGQNIRTRKQGHFPRQYVQLNQ